MFFTQESGGGGAATAIDVTQTTFVKRFEVDKIKIVLYCVKLQYFFKNSEFCIVLRSQTRK